MQSSPSSNNASTANAYAIPMALHIRRIGMVSRTYAHVRRYREILTVLIKYGFGGVLDALQISRYIDLGINFITRRTTSHVAGHSVAARVRMALEELGPTFIKFGQVLAARPDLVPEDFVREFQKLLQHVPPAPVDEIRKIIAAELGRPVEHVFQNFDPEPLAAASIGQVHRATLFDGDHVVVKVQRPGIRRTIEVDLEILLHLATLLERNINEVKLHKPTRLVDEFSRTLSLELDFLSEASHLERFAQQFNEQAGVYVPNVFREFSTTRILTLEYIDGVRLGDFADFTQLDTLGFNRTTIARRGAEIILESVFRRGFFHADPHAGNIFLLPDDVICYLDFGMMGRLDQRARELISDLIHGAVRRDVPATISAVLELTEADDDAPPLNRQQLERDVGEVLDRHMFAAISELDMGALLNALLKLAGRHRRRIPADLVLMLKAMGVAQALAVRLDPQLDMVGLARPYLERLRVQRYSPKRIAQLLTATAGSAGELLRELPEGVREMIRAVREGSVRLRVEHSGLDQFLAAQYFRTRKQIQAALAAAAFLGSTLFIFHPHAAELPTWLGLPLFTWAGYLLSATFAWRALRRPHNH